MKPGAALLDRAGRLLDFLWSGWAGLAALALLAAAWQAGHEAWGAFILPDPLETVKAAIRLMGEAESRGLLMLTAQRSLAGFVLAASAGVAIPPAAKFGTGSLPCSCT